MTWRNAAPTATDPDARTSRLDCNGTRPAYTTTRTGTLKATTEVPCYAAVIGFPDALTARGQARDAGWRVAMYGENVDRCPYHVTRINITAR